jgi:3-hydroxybutyryl-CoA dehydrogenase
MSAIRSVLDRNVEKGRMQAVDRDAVLGRLHGTTDMHDFSDCDLVVEAVTENMEVKKQIFSTLDKVCPGEAILATNTSCLSIIDMAMATGRVDKVLGLHFFNPVPVMKLLEIVKTIATGEATLNTCKEFGAKVGKQVVVAQDAPGFIVNRLLVPFILNAIRMMDSGIATKEDIDTGINLGLNHPMGPLTLADLIGLDTLYFIASAIYDELKDPQYASPPLLGKMVKAGWLGRKTGKGFYNYGK